MLTTYYHLFLSPPLHNEAKHVPTSAKVKEKDTSYNKKPFKNVETQTGPFLKPKMNFDESGTASKSKQ